MYFMLIRAAAAVLQHPYYCNRTAASVRLPSFCCICSIAIVLLHPGNTNCTAAATVLPQHSSHLAAVMRWHPQRAVYSAASTLL